MKLLLISAFIIFNLISASIPDINDSKWNNVQNDNIRIDYLWDQGLPWCKAIITLNHSSEKILSVIKDISNYENIFDSVISSKEYNNNIVHIVLDLPGMFNNRDYVVQFDSINDNKPIIYEFKSIKNVIELSDDFVRLSNAGGKWKLESKNNNLTKVTYIWNGDMAGNFPSWGLKRAWIKQGNEVLTNLKTALDNNGDF